MELTDKIRRVYLPMTETGFYILFCLQKEGHGYSITQKVKEMTDSQVSISPGTMYGTLSKMEKDGLISSSRTKETKPSFSIFDRVPYMVPGLMETCESVISLTFCVIP